MINLTRTNPFNFPVGTSWAVRPKGGRKPIRATHRVTPESSISAIRGRGVRLLRQLRRAFEAVASHPKDANLSSH